MQRLDPNSMSPRLTLLAACLIQFLGVLDEVGGQPGVLAQFHEVARVGRVVPADDEREVAQLRVIECRRLCGRQRGGDRRQGGPVLLGGLRLCRLADRSRPVDQVVGIVGILLRLKELEVKLEAADIT